MNKCDPLSQNEHKLLVLSSKNKCFVLIFFCFLLFGDMFNRLYLRIQTGAFMLICGSRSQMWSKNKENNKGEEIIFSAGFVLVKTM